MRLTFLEAGSVGRMSLSNRWAATAALFFELWTKGRSDLISAIQECAPMLSFWNRATVAFRTRQQTISEDDWWSALLEIVVDLYPHGVDDQNIWDEAAGDVSRVRGESGREEWTHALRLLRKGGAGKHITVAGFLHQMRNDFYSNYNLKLLEDLYLRCFN